MTPHARRDPPRPSLTGHPQTRSIPLLNAAHQRDWLMWVVCLPVLALVGVLVLTGAWGALGVVYALVCVVIMAVMMLWMSHGTKRPTDRFEEHSQG